MDLLQDRIEQDKAKAKFLGYWSKYPFAFVEQPEAGEMIYEATLAHPGICFDEVSVKVFYRDQMRVLEVWARGCVSVICATSLLKEIATGKSLAWLDTFTDDEWLDTIKVRPQTETKRQCMLLPLQCLRKAFSN